MEESEEDEEDSVEVIESENAGENPAGGEEPQEEDEAVQNEGPEEGAKTKDNESEGEDESEEEDETEDEKETDTKNKKSRAKADEQSPAPKKKKSGIPMIGLIVTLLGAIGIVGAVLLDPIMNMMDASHPAAIAIGSMQMIGVGVAAIVLVVGIVIAVVMRK
jgi:cobalamin biosynthesis Mg chelatase CobN